MVGTPQDGTRMGGVIMRCGSLLFRERVCPEGGRRERSVRYFEGSVPNGIAAHAQILAGLFEHVTAPYYKC